MRNASGVSTGPGSVLHPQRPTATEEAKRLAKHIPDCTFFVMEAQYGYTSDQAVASESQKITVQII